MIKSMHVYISLTEQKEAQERAIVGALLASNRLDAIDTITLWLPSYLERPGALEYPLVQLAIKAIRHRSWNLILGFSRWVAWPGLVTEYPLPISDDHLDPASWAVAIDNARTQARRVGAKSALQLEIYGNGPQQHVEDVDVFGTEREIIEGAIAMATRAFGRVDYARPGVLDANPSKYYCSFGGVADVLMDHRTYGRDWNDGPMEPPSPQPYLWGMDVLRVGGWDAAMEWATDDPLCIGVDYWLKGSEFAKVLLGDV